MIGMKLGDIITFERGLTYAKGDEVADSSIGVLRSNNVDLSSHRLNFDEIKYLRNDFDVPAKKRVRRSSILMCMSNGSKDHLGKVAIIDEDLDYAFGGFMGLLTPNEDVVVPKYLYYALVSQAFKDHIHSLSDGANINNLKYSDLSVFEVPVPLISEQQRIVDLLDAEFEKIDALKENAERNLQNTKDLFQSTLKKELEPKDGWATKTLGEMCIVQGGSTPRRTEKSFWDGGTYPWFTVDDIREQGRFISNTKQKVTKLAWDKLRVFPAESVLLCCTASVGEYAMTTIPISSNQQFNGITVRDKSKLLPMYLFHFASTLKDTLLSMSGKATIDFVSGEKVRCINISYPQTLVEQRSIISRLDDLSNRCKSLQANYEKTLALCDDLKQALLRKAFNGEL